MTTFDGLYGRWRELRFPRGSHRDDVDELHADLALVDTWVADTIVPYVEQGAITLPQVDIAAGIRDIRSRAIALREGPAGEERALLDRYIDYVDLIEKLYAAFRTEQGD